MKVAIAGAGIAGLASAAFLARDGHDVTVYDEFTQPRPVGSGLMVQPVGMAVLTELGLSEQTQAIAAPVSQVVGRIGSGRAVLDLRYRDLSEDAQGLGIQRGALFFLLLRAAEAAGATIRTDTPIVGLSDRDGTPSLLRDTGALEPADLVLNCLGTSSPLCHEPSRPLAYGALWGLLGWPTDGPFAPDRLEQRYEAASRMAGVLPVGRLEPGAARKLTFFWSLRCADLDAWRARPLDAWKDDVRALWPETDAVLDQIGSHDDLVFASCAHRTLSAPAAGPVAHLGDSFHATSPQLGQGANMALLDALALHHALRARPNPCDATALYSRMRSFHVRLYQSASWLFTPVYQSDSQVLPWVRDRVAAPLSRMWPMPRLLAQLVTGELADPVGRILGPDIPA